MYHLIQTNRASVYANMTSSNMAGADILWNTYNAIYNYCLECLHNSPNRPGFYISTCIELWTYVVNLS